MTHRHANGEVRVVPGDAEGVLELVIDRPDRRNALTPAMLADLTTLTQQHAPAARVLLLRGEGRSFCAGFDLDHCVDDPGVLRDLLAALSRAIDALRRADVAVVCAVHGAAIAGGCALLGGADIVVAHHDARLGYPVTRLGISPAVSAPFLAHSAGGRARHALLVPEVMSGADALRIGLVHALAPDRDSVLPEARRIARDLAGKPGVGIVATRAWLRELEALTQPTGSTHRALDASLAGVGAPEQTRMLASVWAAHQTPGR